MASVEDRTLTDSEMELLSSIAMIDDNSRSDANYYLKARKLFQQYDAKRIGKENSLVYQHLAAIFRCSKEPRGSDQHIISVHTDTVKWGRIDQGGKY